MHVKFYIWLIGNLIAQNPTGGAIRAIMMCIHAYFNIWCEARAGWSVFMKRRSAVHKISALPEATPAQLQAFDDVCAICYQVSCFTLSNKRKVQDKKTKFSILNTILGNVFSKNNKMSSFFPWSLLT